MSDETRTAVLHALWGAVRGLVPTSKLVDVTRLAVALEHVYDDYGEARFEAGLKLGLLSVEAREDRRDLGDVREPPECRSVH